MPPAARVSDNHVCPRVEPGPNPHKGGPVLPPCEQTVLIDGRAAARVDDTAECSGPPDAIADGSQTVVIGFRKAARLGDPTVHGGRIVEGSGTVMIGE